MGRPSPAASFGPVADLVLLLRDAASAALVGEPDAEEVLARVDAHGPALVDHFSSLYGGRGDLDARVADLGDVLGRAAAGRPEELRRRDRHRAERGDWFRSHAHMGAVAYVDRFAGTIDGVRARLPYLAELGVTYLHLMPLFAVPDGPDDGGYAVSDYRSVRPDLGSMDDLRRLATALHESGVSLALDLVFNHTADDHPWARAARAGDPHHRAFYHLFEDRLEPDRWDRHLREIFPGEHRGCFTELEDGTWVWTTFHTYQWDLDYRNPHVLTSMLGELLFLANVGVDVFRLDAVPFIWKEAGTTCENLPEVHTILRVLNRAVRIAAPSVAFKSEAIVHPDAVASYLEAGEGAQCELSYNPLLMCELWEALATSHTHLLRHSVRHRFSTPDGCSWVNYARSHDDIGWGFADEDATALGINPTTHRYHLNRWYLGEVPGSLASGLPFQANPDTGDLRISGTTASLCGLERAIADGDPTDVELALRRVELLHALVVATPGLPLLYLGDELATTNDYRWVDEPDRADDTRWAHRPAFDPARASMRHDPATIPGRVHGRLRSMVELRRSRPAFGPAAVLEVFDPTDLAVFAFRSTVASDEVVVAANFAPRAAVAQPHEVPLVHGRTYRDLLGGRVVHGGTGLALDAHEVVWLVAEEG